ncbi:MAG: thiamine-phosphate kinase [Thermodesulfovibrio sp.]|uniref:thiamine-phosphate kinase n=1 Tax=Thermodesulfovibrio sp. 1176 TaxID=3043424 RepID=UPI002482DCC0|nr:thiamine-phosphate kinase [Thermodesulfovibrio sp. 1176]MDI1471353.1 thiamine-phosphate kinase [Thermodesulfovibrio sp. 1176]MDI6714621.1 thiamine-phosphate kinase [Thermodesulfovibrio sp.]
MKKDEIAIIKDIRNKFFFPEGIGIGDDSAVLRFKESALITTDLMIEDVHFDLSFTSFYHLGFKIVSINVSDIYAMGGDFRGFLFSLGAPQTISDEDFNELFSGIKDALNHYGGFLIGGDLSKSDKIVLSGVAIGETERPILRKGAEPEDLIYITSYLGLSQAGFYLLRNLSKESKKIVKSIKNFDLLNDFSESFLSFSESFLRHSEPFIGHSERSEESYIKITHKEGDPSATPQGDRKKCNCERSEESNAKVLNLPERKIRLKEIKEILQRHLMPAARKPDKFRNNAKAMMDISDGLLIDLHRLCEESGVGAEIYIDEIPIHPEVAQVAELFHIDPMKIILSGGEDYELLVVSDKENVTETGLIPIGKIIKDKGIYIVDSMKGKLQAKPEGWQHF